MPRTTMFSMTVNPLLSDSQRKINWEELSDQSLEDELNKAVFPTADELESYLKQVQPLDANKSSCALSWVFSSERGEETKIPHYQGLLVTDKGTTAKQVRDQLAPFIYKLIKCPQLDVSPANSPEGLHSYVRKNPWIVEKSEYAVGVRETRFNKVEYYKSVQPELELVLDTPFPWQQYVVKLLRRNPDSRSIPWFTDPQGNTGKTTFGKAVSYLMPELGMMYLQPDRHDRLKAFVGESIKRYKGQTGSYPRGYILNLPRATTAAEIKGSCKTIEELKDGVLQSNFSANYVNELIKIPHVIVLSNNGPDLTAQSQDRWQVYWIGNKQVKYCVQPVVVHPFVISYDPELRTVRWNTKLVPIGNKEYNLCDSGVYNDDHYDPEIKEFRETIVETYVVSTGKINTPEMYYKNTQNKQILFKDCVIECFEDYTDHKDCPMFVRKIVSDSKMTLIERYAKTSGDWTYYNKLKKADQLAYKNGFKSFTKKN